jgi:ectoine hydroxylase-related dioxygenase (phytanoyl-CoA dioxygenase family)
MSSVSVPFILSREARPSAVVASLEQNGIAVLEGYLTAASLDALKSAVSATFDERGTHDLRFATGEVKRLAGDGLSAALRAHPTLRPSHETESLVRATCDDFFGGPRWELHSLYAMRYRDKMPTNEKFHIDPSATVKFFYYLSDVTAETGPFTYCVGSHREGYFRMRCGALEGTPGSMVIPDNEVRNATPIEGRAGTLIVFNSIGIHRAGTLTPGTSRFSVTYHYAVKHERSLRRRIFRRLRGTADVEQLCAYAQKHQSRAYPYTE